MLFLLSEKLFFEAWRNPKFIKTNGFRLYVFGTFECDGAVDCSGTAGASGGAGTNSGTLVGGVEGGNGGAGAPNNITNTPNVVPKIIDNAMIKVGLGLDGTIGGTAVS